MSINKGQIISTIEAELENIVKTSNRTIQIMESDPDISACVHGRNLKQITGKAEMTEARFPNLLNKVKGLIAMNVLRKAQDNYNKKLEKMISDATKEASLEIAQYMCNKMTQGGGNTNKINGTDPYKQLTPAYGIVYEVGNGMKLEDIAGRGDSVKSLVDARTDIENTARRNESKGFIGSLENVAINTVDAIFRDNTAVVTTHGGVTKEVTSIFDKESRTCEICTTITKEHCDKKLAKKNPFWKADEYENVCNSEVGKPSCRKVGM